MDFRNILFLVVVSLLLMGCVSAQKNVSDFQIDNSYSSAFNGSNVSLYLNEKHDAGITVYKYLEFNVDDIEDGPYDDLIHDNGRDYLTPDDDFKLDKNPDNTFNFTDYDHGQHGVGEVINVDGDKFIIIVWAKDSSNINNSDLISKLSNFNKDNSVEAIAF